MALLAREGWGATGWADVEVEEEEVESGRPSAGMERKADEGPSSSEVWRRYVSVSGAEQSDGETPPRITDVAVLAVEMGVTVEAEEEEEVAPEERRVCQYEWRRLAKGLVDEPSRRPWVKGGEGKR